MASASIKNDIDICAALRFPNECLTRLPVVLVLRFLCSPKNCIDDCCGTNLASSYSDVSTLTCSDRRAVVEIQRQRRKGGDELTKVISFRHLSCFCRQHGILAIWASFSPQWTSATSLNLIRRATKASLHYCILTSLTFPLLV